jgi:hypothetical protein
MAYIEVEVPVVTTGNNGNGSMWGSDGIWAILLLALLGNRGFGFGGGSGFTISIYMMSFWGFSCGRISIFPK